jgi:hypothetical protein
MKKVLLVISFITILASCEGGDKVVISKEEYKQLKGDTIKPKYPKPFKLYAEGLDTYESGIVLGSDQHEYIVTNLNSNSENVEHYVDCKLCAAREVSERARLIMDLTLPKKTNEHQ